MSYLGVGAARNEAQSSSDNVVVDERGVFSACEWLTSVWYIG